MDGILLIDKPEGFTSHDVVARLRRILKTKRIGHTGTLDPFATGVLVMLVGKATRLAQFVDKDEKEYVALVRFGSKTDTGDRTGQVVERNEGGVPELSEILPRFVGDIEQVPPMYSAKKIAGKKLYEIARGGGEVERKALTVSISELELIDPAEIWPGSAIEATDVGIRVVCSAGTYIRTLAEDIGKAAGTVAHLAELRRTRAGEFSLDGAVLLGNLAEMTDPSAALRPLSEAVAHLPDFTVEADRIEPTRSGLSTSSGAESFEAGGFVRMVNGGGELIAIGVADTQENLIRPKIVLR
ncbi:MAG: tRNA pseudouridine(55) synthase TruB [Blastocatellia bacterium]|nr:tRNA pseudouridine(55) synthase TruB [Blastocatellia bacterium]